MKNALLNYENIFYLNSTTISGITSIDGSYSINYEPIKTIGVGYSKQIIAEVPVANFSIDKYLLYNDPFLQFTGENRNRTAKSFRGSINYNGKKLGFQSGYLNSFSLSCSVGEVPTTTADIIVYGDLGPNYNASGNFKPPELSVPQIKDITLTCSGSSSNRITSFDYSINCPKQPIYLINQSGYNYSGPNIGPTTPLANYIPSEVLLNVPIEADASFTLEVDDYESQSLYDRLTNDIDNSFSINIKGVVFQDQPLSVNSQDLDVNGQSLLVMRKAVGLSLFSESFNNFKLVSQQFSSDADNVLSVKLNYKGYLNT
jgi:hypothetical protein